MANIKVAKRYAKSLFMLSVEQKFSETADNDMQLIANTCEENRDLRLLLSNPIIKEDKKVAILNEIFKGKISEITTKFIAIVGRKGRASSLLLIAQEFHKFMNELKGIQEADITTAFPIDSDLKQDFEEIVKGISGKKADLSVSIDEDIIGGFLLKVGDRQIDETIKSKLKSLRVQLLS